MYTVFFTVTFGVFALGRIGTNIGAVVQARVAGAYIFEVIERIPTIDYSNYDEKIDIPSLSPSIEFKDV